MRILITGGCGFLGTNLARASLERGHQVFVLDNLHRLGSAKNLEFLQSAGTITWLNQDIRSREGVEDAVRLSRPDVVFHLCGQVAMTVSIADPRADFEVNVLGGHNVLEALRLQAPEAIVLFSSTNKVYGDLESLDYIENETRYVNPAYPEGFDESLHLDFRSPYGCSKGAIDQYMLDYHRIFGLRTVVFRHSSIFGERQFSTYDQGWVGWFIREALRQKLDKGSGPCTISGNGKQVRDLLFASDLVSCYFAALEHIEDTAGQAFNIGGGPENSLSILELFAFLESELQTRIALKKLTPRQSDQKVFVADTAKAGRLFGWKPQRSKYDGLTKMIEWVAHDSG